MERQRLLENWNTVRLILPTDAPPLQIREMKRAFYAGAAAFYSILMNHLQPGAPDVVTDADLDMMAELHNELTAFQKKVKEGIE